MSLVHLMKDLSEGKPAPFPVGGWWHPPLHGPQEHVPGIQCSSS